MPEVRTSLLRPYMPYNRSESRADQLKSIKSVTHDFNMQDIPVFVGDVRDNNAPCITPMVEHLINE